MRARCVFAVAVAMAAGTAGGVFAQDSVVMAAPPRVLDAARLQPTTLVYQASLKRGDSTRVLGERSVALASAVYGGQGAWLIVERTQGAAQYALLDSLWVERATMHPLHWSTYADFTRVIAEFRADSVFGGVTSPAGRRTIVADLPASALVTAGMSEIALPLYPLAAGFSDSVSVVATDLARMVVLRGALDVLGEERITVPAGTFETWLVSLTTDAGGPTYWVAKKEGIVVRSTRLVPETGALLAYDLTAISR